MSGRPPTQPRRLPFASEADQTQLLNFTFNGKRLTGHPGDTLASALLANDIRLVGRSFKYHRPRGILGIGSEEPNALVGLRSGNRQEPNSRATMIELFDGLEASSQNCWPFPAIDVQGVNSLIADFIPAGFYYKTFMWPPKWWTNVYEKIIRRAAGMGRGSHEPDPDRYARSNAHCDLLVVGGGPSGLTAALTAARSGARVILCDETNGWGGSLRHEAETLDGSPASEWVAAVIAELSAMENVTLLPRTTAFGYYDHNQVGLVERVADHLPVPPEWMPRQRMIAVRAKRVILATGAVERPIVFPGNDRPGVMMASAVRGYINRFAIQPGDRAVIFTNNDSGYRTAADLMRAGTEIAAIVDSRESAGESARAIAATIPVHFRSAIVETGGHLNIRHVDVQELTPGGQLNGNVRRIACDLLCMAGGWTPSVHLASQSGGRMRYDDALTTFVPESSKQAEISAGSAKGFLGLDDCLGSGVEAAVRSLAAIGREAVSLSLPATEPAVAGKPIEALWEVPKAAHTKSKAFVDHQDDVTADDVRLAHREGFISVEHLKRYTTLGMGTDQGKTSNVNGLAIMAAARGLDIPEVGTTTFRPPVSAVTIGAFAGGETGQHYMPTRRTPMHDWHVANGAEMQEVGLWMRPRWYLRDGETAFQAHQRETRHVREKVGLNDVSTLGKIDIQGPDAAEFLNRVYVNGWKTLPVGKARYGLMLREDGFVFDDGTTSRLGEQHYLMTTTTANAVPVMRHLEFHLQAVWPDLDVHVTSVTDQFASMALAGPLSRTVLEQATGMALDNESFPYLGVRDGVIAGAPVTLFRISFSGELAWEIMTPADYGMQVWEHLMETGASSGIIAYGTETLANLRIEKGHVAGAELDGRTTPGDLGLERMISTKKDFIGRHMLGRPELQRPDRARLVGLVPVDGTSPIRGGSQLVEDPSTPAPVPMIGWVTSSCTSPNLGHPIALGFIEGGMERAGSEVFAMNPLQDSVVRARIVSPHFLDPEGKRLEA
jgi:sarcosine oxidase subunit alpha